MEQPLETHRHGPWVYYRLADEPVFQFLRVLQRLGRNRLAEVEQVARGYIDERDAFAPVDLRELQQLARDDGVTNEPTMILRHYLPTDPDALVALMLRDVPPRPPRAAEIRAVDMGVAEAAAA